MGDRINPPMFYVLKDAVLGPGKPLAKNKADVNGCFLCLSMKMAARLARMRVQYGSSFAFALITAKNP
jgi:hypothetical protein